MFLSIQLEQIVKFHMYWQTAGTFWFQLQSLRKLL